jgi:AcrR family transcriptional regulator
MTPSSRKPRDRKPLSRRRIADEALTLIDEEGIEACSMRTLGRRLGVEAMAIYHHFKNKGELLDGVVERLVEELVLPESDAPLERLRKNMCSFRAVAINHPRAFVLLAMRRFNSESNFIFYDKLLLTFSELGLNAQDSARWFRLIGGYVIGAGLAEVASRELNEDATPLLLEHAPTGIAFERIRAVSEHLQVAALEQAFEFSLDILFKALLLHIQESKRH